MYLTCAVEMLFNGRYAKREGGAAAAFVARSTLQHPRRWRAAIRPKRLERALKIGAGVGDGACIGRGARRADGVQYRSKCVWVCSLTTHRPDRVPFSVTGRASPRFRATFTTTSLGGRLVERTRGHHSRRTFRNGLFESHRFHRVRLNFVFSYVLSVTRTKPLHEIYLFQQNRY